MPTFQSDAEYNECIKMRTTYEWVAEVVDDYGDIINTDVIDNPKESDRMIVPDDCTLWIALRRIHGSEALGENERGYAYVYNGKLETEFSCGNKVPKRFNKEI